MNSELVGSMRNTERMVFNYVHNVEMPSEKCLTFCLFPLLARIAEWRNVPRQNHRNYASSESRDRKMLGNKNSFSCQSNFAFCCDKIHPKPYRGLPQASQGITVVFHCRQVSSRVSGSLRCSDWRTVNSECSSPRVCARSDFIA